MIRVQHVLLVVLFACLLTVCPAAWAQDDDGWEPPSIPATDEEAKTSMYYAIQNDEPKTLAFLLKNCPKAVNLSNGELIQAVVSMNKGPEILKLLLDAGADVNVLQEGTKQSLLHQAIELVLDDKDSDDTKAANAKLLGMIKMLIEKGAKANEARTSDGYTPLLQAAANENVKKAFFEALLAAKDVDVNAKSSAGANMNENYTPLFFVIARNQIEGNENKEIVDLLLAKGADLKHLSGKSASAGRHEKKNALHLACETTGDRADIVEALLAKGMDIEAMADDDYSPLHLAAMANNPKICKLLLEKGAKVDSRNKGGVTVLDHCKGAGKDKNLESADVVINWKK